MVVKRNELKMCYEVYCDSQSDYQFMENLSHQTVKPIETMMKQHLNSIYGKVVTNMSKDYIVAHRGSDKDIQSVAIIFKSHICAVSRHEDGTADIHIDGGYAFDCTDKYEEIVKQLV